MKLLIYFSNPEQSKPIDRPEAGCIMREAAYPPDWRGVSMRSLMAFRQRGLLEYFAAGRWYLTDAGREYVQQLARYLHTRVPL